MCTAFYIIKDNRVTSNGLPIQHLEVSKITETDIGKYISRNHDYWNNALCWGHSKNFSFVEFNKQYGSYIKELDHVINSVGDQDLKEDFTHTKALLAEAEATNDIKPLIDVHRIFHDLDVDYNHYSTKDYFGVTQYGEKQ